MKNLNDIQQALINIFKVSIRESSLTDLVETCHKELLELMGEEKAKNFYLALHVGDSFYTIPYYRDDKDTEDPVDEAFSLKGGLTDYIRRTGKTEWIDRKRIRELMDNGEMERMVGVLSYEWVGAPLNFNENVNGVLVVQTYEDNVHYSHDDVELIDYVSRNIALAIERKSKETQLSEYRQNLEELVESKSRELINKNKTLEIQIDNITRKEMIQKVLFSISEAKSHSRNIRELLKVIHDQVCSLMEARNFYVAILEDEEKGLYRLPYIADENPEDVLDPESLEDLSRGYTHYVLKSGAPLLAHRRKLEALIASGEVGMLGTQAQSWLGIPLKTEGGRVIGVVAIQSYSDPNAYSETDQEVLSIISSTIAGAVEFKQLEEEKKILEQKLLESQKMDAVGILAAGVAHEFNNLLSIIIGHAYNGYNDSDGESQNKKRYDKIIKSSERAAELVDKLMIFAQKRERGKYFIDDLKRAIQSSVFKIRDRVPPGCDIALNIQDDLWTVRIDRQELDDVMSNLLDNALWALDKKEGGRVLVSAENISGNTLPSRLRRHQKYVCIRVEDNGIGMSRETLEQIFNPFFTTRDPGQGAGLGLPIVYAIVNEYYGIIHVDSQPGKGSVVYVYLPTQFSL